MTCEKKRSWNWYYCERCRTKWQLGDPLPPPCMAQVEREQQNSGRLAAFIVLGGSLFTILLIVLCGWLRCFPQ